MSAAIESGLRPGETLQRLIHNYLEFELQVTRRQPLILVVNPDIFYYALYFRYGAHDRRNVFERFLTAFDYIVVDEFHYYDYKQLANFLFAFPSLTNSATLLCVVAKSVYFRQHQQMLWSNTLTGFSAIAGQGLAQTTNQPKAKP